MSEPRFLALGDTALSVEFDSCVDRAINARVMALDARLTASNIDGLIETVPSFRALMVQFDPLRTDADAMTDRIRTLLTGLETTEGKGRLWRLPACYEGIYAPDLDEVAEATGLSTDAVVARHAEIEHGCYMIGFLPGLPYLGDLPDGFDIPRRRNPRLRVPRGSVAIAVGLTVVYPVESPGGWNVIGRTPVPLFDTAWNPPAMIAPGDRVVFEPIDATVYEALETEIAAGAWMLTPEERS